MDCEMKPEALVHAAVQIQMLPLLLEEGLTVSGVLFGGEDVGPEAFHSASCIWQCLLKQHVIFHEPVHDTFLLLSAQVSFNDLGIEDGASLSVILTETAATDEVQNAAWVGRVRLEQALWVLGGNTSFFSALGVTYCCAVCRCVHGGA